MQGYKDPFNRRCYPWGNEDSELIAYVKTLGQIRKSSPAFADGTMKFIYNDNEIMGFKRYSEEEDMLIFVNRSANQCNVEPFFKLIKKYSISEAVHGEITDSGLTVNPYDFAAIRCIK
jgi:glycosidase